MQRDGMDCVFLHLAKADEKRSEALAYEYVCVEWQPERRQYVATNRMRLVGWLFYLLMLQSMGGRMGYAF